MKRWTIPDQEHADWHKVNDKKKNKFWIEEMVIMFSHLPLWLHYLAILAIKLDFIGKTVYIVYELWKKCQNYFYHHFVAIIAFIFGYDFCHSSLNE